MIATYWVGPAFGWANLRGCTNLGDELFTGGEVHPADDARTMAIRLVIEKFQEQQSASVIDVRWSELMGLSGQQKPQEYGLVYPKDLVEKVVKSVCETCSQLQLVSFRDQCDADDDCIAGLLNDAWERFTSTPDSYGEFERQRITSLKASLGMPA